MAQQQETGLEGGRQSELTAWGGIMVGGQFTLTESTYSPYRACTSIMSSADILQGLVLPQLGWPPRGPSTRGRVDPCPQKQISDEKGEDQEARFGGGAKVEAHVMEAHVLGAEYTYKQLHQRSGKGYPTGKKRGGSLFKVNII